MLPHVPGEHGGEVCVPSELPTWHCSVPSTSQGHDQKKTWKTGVHGTGDGQSAQGEKPATSQDLFLFLPCKYLLIKVLPTKIPIPLLSTGWDLHGERLIPTILSCASCSLPRADLTQMALPACSQHHSALCTKSLRGSQWTRPTTWTPPGWSWNPSHLHGPHASKMS